MRQSAQENESDRAAAQTAERPSAAPPLAGAASARGITAQGRDASALEIPSPDPQVRWRVVPGTAVQRSTDRGATWATQQTGVTTELTAGSAPAADVCWLVGRGGVVLRTTSAGRAWQRVRFPEPVDLAAVTASSALDATVSLVDGRRFRTTDGGATWFAVP